MKRHELDIKYLLDENNIKYYTYNKKINDKYFPDYVFNCVYYYIILEIDEYQHKKYDKNNEIKRMRDITSSLEMPVIFIRYNPDKYIPYNKEKIIEDDNRKEILLNQLNYYMKLSKDLSMKLTKLSALYLFFDNFDMKNIKILSL